MEEEYYDLAVGLMVNIKLGHKLTLLASQKKNKKPRVNWRSYGDTPRNMICSLRIELMVTMDIESLGPTSACYCGNCVFWSSQVN